MYEIKGGKLYDKQGRVAVLYSPGYGAGWSTWYSGRNSEQMVFSPQIALAVLNGGNVESAANEEFPETYKGGVDTLAVEWLTPGTQFRINEYDGSESIETSDSCNWHTA